VPCPHGLLGFHGKYVNVYPHTARVAGHQHTGKVDIEMDKTYIKFYDGRVVKGMFEGEPEGRRRMRSPSLRWVDDFERDFRKMKVKRWRQKTVNISKWGSHIKRVKALREP
jgi:hypothetical protein